MCNWRTKDQAKEWKTNSRHTILNTAMPFADGYVQRFNVNFPIVSRLNESNGNLCVRSILNSSIRLLLTQLCNTQINNFRQYVYHWLNSTRLRIKKKKRSTDRFTISFPHMPCSNIGSHNIQLFCLKPNICHWLQQTYLYLRKTFFNWLCFTIILDEKKMNKMYRCRANAEMKKRKNRSPQITCDVWKFIHTLATAYVAHLQYNGSIELPCKRNVHLFSRFYDHKKKCIFVICYTIWSNAKT